MRSTFLARGKRVDTGEWVCGYFIEGPHYISHNRRVSAIVPLDETIFFPRNEIIYTEVDPETVGQCTGFVDNKGRFIYEGDIIHLGNGHAVVEYSDRGFICRNEKYGEYWAHYLERESSRIYEIIGNIHDNPELFRYFSLSTQIKQEKEKERIDI